MSFTTLALPDPYVTNIINNLPTVYLAAIVSCFSRGHMWLSEHLIYRTPGPEVIKLFSFSTQLSMKYFLLINVKMPPIVGILTFRSGKNNILGSSEPKISQIS